MALLLRARLHSFKQGFNTIHDAKSFVQLVLVSLAMWLMIAGAYIEVLHAYPQIPVTVAGDAAGVQRVARMNTMKLEDVLLVMGSSMLGSVVQLPGGVGGSQLAVIGVLQSNLFSRRTLQHYPRAGRKLRHHALAGDLHVGDSGGSQCWRALRRFPSCGSPKRARRKRRWSRKKWPGEQWGCCRYSPLIQSR